MKTNFSKLIATFFVAVLSFGFSSCGGDDDEEDLLKAIAGAASAAGTADNPQTPDDPEGTITVNIRNENNGGDISTGIGVGSITIDKADNFVVDGRLNDIVSLGKVNGLSSIKFSVSDVAKWKWANKVAVVPGYGYIVRSSSEYSRLYVIDYMYSTDGGVIGAVVKYQCPWDPDYEKINLCPDNKHPHAIDMGEAGVWACCNVGASKPEDYGSYFAWGETEPKSDYSWGTYKWGKKYDELTKYCNNSKYGKNGFTDTLTELVSDDDAATKNWGSNWRMPSEAQIEQLSKSLSIWTQINGINGRLFTASNGNRIFLPAAGCRYGTSSYSVGSEGHYWSSLPYTSYGYPSYAHLLHFHLRLVGITIDHYGNPYSYIYSDCDRCYGRSVRPVRAQ